MTNQQGPLPSWSEMYPKGRWVFYEGDNPDGFVEMMKSRFGVDVTDPEKRLPDGWGWGQCRECDARWHQPFDHDGDPRHDNRHYGFWCPREIIDQTYGNDEFLDEWPLGS